MALYIAAFFVSISVTAENSAQNPVGNISETVKLHFFDCGQAESQIIELTGGRCMLVDAGTKDYAKKLVSYIKSLGYKKLDIVVATHPHIDHIGGMSEILKNFEIGTFYMPDVSYTTKTYENMMKALKKNGCKCEYIARGSVILDDNVKCTVLSPEKDKTYMRMNNYSAVLRLEYKKFAAILSSDAEIAAEQSMANANLNLKANVYKVGHHGGATSTDESYLNKISPETAIISVGKNNDYGSPSPFVLNILKTKSIKMFRTDEDGTIVVTTNGITYTTQKIKNI